MTNLNRGQYLRKALFNHLQTATRQEGPFTDFKADSAILPALMDWIDGDWRQLRLLLNYVFERGERRGLELAIKEIAGLRGSSVYREMTVWERDLLGIPLEDCIEQYNESEAHQ